MEWTWMSSIDERPETRPGRSRLQPVRFSLADGTTVAVNRTFTENGPEDRQPIVGGLDAAATAA